MIERKNINKIAAVTLLIMMLWLIWQLLISPYAEFLHRQYIEFERSQRKVIALNELLINKETINSKYRAMKNNRSLEKVHLGQNNGVLAEAKLQGVIKRIIIKNKSTLIMSSLSKGNVGNEKIIKIKVSMRGSIESVYKIFHQLENGWPVMVMDNVELRQVNSRYSTNKNILDAVFEVSAFVQ